MRKILGGTLILVLAFFDAEAQDLIFEGPASSRILIASNTQRPVIICDEGDDWLVKKAAGLLAKDIGMVTGKDADVSHQLNSNKNLAIIIGTVSHSKIIQQLVKSNKLNVDKIRNKWEAFQLTTVVAPGYGIQQALVIIGSDRRGAAYGVFELSRQIGVSPWYWWADVPAKRKNSVYFQKGNHVFGSPSVKYRGIFINDEAPALSGWTKEKFGGFNHLFYEKVFELLLRLKANYLWPAMWGSAFYDDDSLNKLTADEYGIVIGTSHHEPLMRAHDEWRRYGSGKWDYDSNETRLKP